PLPRPRHLPTFPTRRSSDLPIIAAIRLQRGIEHVLKQEVQTILICMHGRAMRILLCILFNYDLKYMDLFEHQNLCCYQVTQLGEDRKSTRLNSSHVKNSYAV